MDYVLKMTFVTDQGKSTVLSIPKVRNDLTDSEVKNLMGAFIDIGIIETGGGKVAEKKKGALYATTVTPYALPTE
jgi:hypothetical protein